MESHSAVTLASKLIDINNPMNLHLHGLLKKKINKVAVNYVS